MRKNDPSDSLSRFSEIVLEGRDSGLKTLKSYMYENWRPKNPSAQEMAVISMIEGLDEKGRERLLEVVRYCTDLSFFKFISNLEEGGSGMKFKLEATSEPAGEQVMLINDDEDLGLRSKFWVWLRNHGE